MTDSISLLNASGDTATINLFGGQVLTWRTASSKDLLYLTPQTPLPGKALRGGVPVCFPQFANWGKLVKHGFVRTMPWSVAGNIASGADIDHAHARLELRDTDATRAVWPHAFHLTLDVRLFAGVLEIELGVHNTGAAPFSFTAALHSYFATDDVRQVSLSGLEQSDYLDATDSNLPCNAALAPITVTGEIDRIYNAAPSTLVLKQDNASYLQITQQGFDDCVVWNPGLAKAASLGDMPANDWTRMFCIEAAQIEHAITLEAGQQWKAKQRVTHLPSVGG